MKLVEILARELEEWPDKATHAAVIADNGGYVIRFTTGGAPVWDVNRYTILGTGCGDYVFWVNEKGLDARGLMPQQENMCSREEWQSARAAYLASIQPERDADIKRVVESTKKLPYAFTEADIRAAFAAGANWVLGAIEDGAAEYVEKLKGHK